MTRKMDDEIKQTFETLVALLARRDEIYEETGETPMETYGTIIKLAGELRDELDPEEVPRAENVDPTKYSTRKE